LFSFADMEPRHKNRFWRLCRIYFRRFRITVWLIILALVGSLVYLNQVGLPGIIKRPLLDALRTRGVDLQFSRLRLRWFYGLVAENVRFGRPEDPLGPGLNIAEVQLELNHDKLLHARLQVDSLILRQGRMVWPLPGTNAPSRRLTIENIQTDLHFPDGDQWLLDNFSAEFAGARIRLTGTITNASAVRDWQMFAGGPPESNTLHEHLRLLADALDRLHFVKPPELTMDLRGDAKDMQSFSVRMILMANSGETPWGSFNRGLVSARLYPATNDALARAELKITADSAQTPWAQATNLLLSLRLGWILGQTNLLEGVISLSAGQAWTEWAGAVNPRFDGQWVHSLSNAIPLSGRGSFQCDNARSKWGTAKSIQFEGTGAVRPVPPPAPQEDWGIWTKLRPYLLGYECRLTDVRATNLIVQEASFGGAWDGPRFSVTNLNAGLYGGRLNAHASLDVDSRRLEFDLTSSIDAHKVEPWLSPATRRFLEQFTWEKPPDIAGKGGVTLPPWADFPDHWRQDVRPSLLIEGHFNVGPSSFRGVHADSGQSHFSYSNMVWHLPDLVATRPEGVIHGAHESDDRSLDYFWGFHSTVDVRSIRDLLPPEEQERMDLIGLSQPPDIEAEIRGRWHDDARLDVKAAVALTNFTFHGETIDGFQTSLAYTNQTLLLTTPALQQGPARLSAATVAMDFEAGQIVISNGLSTADPHTVARVIGEDAALTLEPYEFAIPPRVRVDGVVGSRSISDTDLHFRVESGPFSWWRIHADRISGLVHWKGQYLDLTQVQGTLYGGKSSGDAAFQFNSSTNTQCRFSVQTSSTDLRRFMTDIITRTNNLDGTLSGYLVVSNLVSGDWNTCLGYGSLDLRDGLIWDIPVFGVLSPILNGLAPGLGNSRASAATGSFVISNGVVRTDDLDIRSSATRLNYRGSAYFTGRLDARVEAHLLRDVWGVGPIVSTVFWPVTKLFEYKVTGTLSEPRPEPLYLLPKLVLMPFHPFRTLKDLFTEPPGLPSTNAPPTVVQ
jgi:hypothetical protein